MRRETTLSTVLHTLGLLILLQGALLLLPLVYVFPAGEPELFTLYLIPCLVCGAAGSLLYFVFPTGKVYFIQSILVCGLSWIVLSLFAALPFFLSGHAGYLDSYFEAVSGFTTTGSTVLRDLEILPRSLLFWKCLLQWTGGLGILTLFLAITARTGGGAYHHLFSAESHKIGASRPVPGLLHTVIILWSIYIAFTVVLLILLLVFGLSVEDALNHSLTTVSTGGFSPWNHGLDHFRLSGHPHYRAVEYTLALFMFLGGINFVIHYLFFTRRFREALSNREFRMYLLIILLALGLILTDHLLKSGPDFLPAGLAPAEWERIFRTTLLAVVSTVTTTGYSTPDIASGFFPAASKLVLLILMLTGGCVGSTAGGLKVMRISVLDRLFRLQLKKLRMPRFALSELVYEGEILPDAEIKRIAGLVAGWLFLIAAGGIITALFTDLDPFQSVSGMFSALGNVGPSYIPAAEMPDLPAVVKITLIIGMLAGRLEILPVLFIFNPRAWRN
jgi:trk system potassium uptake protein TrkH